MSSQQEKKLRKLLWIDKTFNEGQNQDYLKTLTTLPFDLKPFKTVNEGFNFIKTIPFEKIILIVRGTMFENFLKMFKEEINNIKCTVDIVIFTSKKHKNLVEDICINDKYISSGFLFNNKKIFITFSALCNYLNGKTDLNSKDKEQSEQIFEKIENYEQLIFPIYYQELIKPITIEKIMS